MIGSASFLKLNGMNFQPLQNKISDFFSGRCCSIICCFTDCCARSEMREGMIELTDTDTNQPSTKVKSLGRSCLSPVGRTVALRTPTAEVYRGSQGCLQEVEDEVEPSTLSGLKKNFLSSKEVVGNRGIQTPLELGCKKNDPRTLKNLLEYGIDLKQINLQKHSLERVIQTLLLTHSKYRKIIEQIARSSTVEIESLDEVTRGRVKEALFLLSIAEKPLECIQRELSHDFLLNIERLRYSDSTTFDQVIQGFYLKINHFLEGMSQEISIAIEFFFKNKGQIKKLSPEQLHYFRETGFFLQLFSYGMNELVNKKNYTRDILKEREVQKEMEEQLAHMQNFFEPFLEQLKSVIRRVDSTLLEKLVADPTKRNSPIGEFHPGLGRYARVGSAMAAELKCRKKLSEEE